MVGGRPGGLLPLCTILCLPAAGCGSGGDDGGSRGEVDAGSVSQADASAPADVCGPSVGEEVSFDPAAPPCERLSSYRFFTDGPGQVPNQGVVPYDLNSPLFSDYATKHRFIWLPPGQAMAYSESGVFDMPVGSVIIKTFSYRTDLRDPESAERLVETRLLVHLEERWQGRVYLWNDEQTEAVRRVAGAIVPVEWIHTDGMPRELGYRVPNTNQCKECHVADDVATPIGIKARHLNRDFDAGDGALNQLTRLTAIGYLTGAPEDPAQAPRAPVWDDPATGTVDERARAWLDINCAHCHSQVGPARTSGLDLTPEQSDPSQYGVCKVPVSAGPGAGGLEFDIVPGAPDDSIFIYRLASVEPEVRMPELLRQTVHEESLALMKDWIAQLPGACAAPE